MLDQFHTLAYGDRVKLIGAGDPGKGNVVDEPLRLLTLIEAPFSQATRAIERVVKVKNLVHNAWIRLVILDPETGFIQLFEDGGWRRLDGPAAPPVEDIKECAA